MSVSRPNSLGTNLPEVRIYAGQGINTLGEASLPFESIPPQSDMVIYLPCTLTSSNISPGQEQVEKVMIEIAPADGVTDIEVYGNLTNRYKAKYTDYDPNHFRDLWLNGTGRFNLNTIRVDVVSVD